MTLNLRDRSSYTRIESLTRFDAATRHLGLMVALTFVTGLVDAGGYLALDRVFVGNMTGNVVVLGMGAAGAEGLPVLGPALALATFVLGAGVGGLALRFSPSGWSPRLTAVTLCSVALVATTAVLIGVTAADTVKVAAAASTA